MSDEPQSLESLGGANRVAEFVDEAFGRVYADEELRAIFEHANEQRVEHMKTQIVAVMTDRPVRYSDAELMNIHHGKGIQEKHFSRLVRHIVDVLEEHGTSQELVGQILARLALYSNRITGMPNVDG